MSKVLLVIPHDRFHDEEFETVFNYLKSEGYNVAVGSSHHTEAQGHYRTLVKPDINVSFVEPSDYEGLVFIGGRGIDEYINNRNIISLVRAFYEKEKCIAALGRAVEILVYSGIISGKRVTCDISTIPKVQGAAGYYTGALAEEDGSLVTGTGEAARFEFAKKLDSVLKWKTGRGELYARTT